jgi:hypothetical protein
MGSSRPRGTDTTIPPCVRDADDILLDTDFHIALPTENKTRKETKLQEPKEHETEKEPQEQAANNLAGQSPSNQPVSLHSYMIFKIDLTPQELLDYFQTVRQAAKLTSKK